MNYGFSPEGKSARGQNGTEEKKPNTDGRAKECAQCDSAYGRYLPIQLRIFLVL